MNREQQRQELESKLETVIMQDASYSSTVKMCADICEEYINSLFEDSDYVKNKINEINTKRKKQQYAIYNIKKQEKEKLLEWQKGIKKARGKEYSLRVIANIIGVSKQSVHKWDSGISKIPINKAKLISKMLNYPLPDNL